MIKGGKGAFFNLWTTLLGLNIVGFTFTGSLANPYHYSMIKGILLTGLIFYPFYHLSKRNVIKPKHLIRFLGVLTPLFILQFHFRADTILSERGSGQTDVVNNAAYLFVGLIPYLFFITKRKIFASVWIVIILFYIIQSAKRGAVIAAGVGFISFAYFHIRTLERKNKIKGYILVLLAFIGFIYFARDLYESNSYLMMRMESISDGGFSGRDIIYRNLINSWIGSDNIINLIFGFGFASSLTYSGLGLSAHNDWLELLVNFGLIGVLIYGGLFVSGFKKVLSTKWLIERKLILFTILLIILVNTMVYRFYSEVNSFLYVVILGYLFGTESMMKMSPHKSGQ